MTDTLRHRDRLILALDVPDAAVARALVAQLGNSVSFYKIGLELYCAPDCDALIDSLIAQDKKVFLDLKLHDIPRTVGAAVCNAAGRGVTFLTIHAAQQAMLEAAAEAKGEHLQLLAVTVLTSMEQTDLAQESITMPLTELVTHRARNAITAGCDGVVASGLEAPILRKKLGNDFRIICPGIRPADHTGGDDQKRVVTVERAFENGADCIVVGRPIRDAADPRRAAEAIQQTIAAVFNPLKPEA